MNAKLQAIIKKHKDEINKNNFDNIVRDAIKEGVLDELLDDFYKVDITISPEIVTKQLYDSYIMRVVKTDEERAQYMRKINYLINKHQTVIVKTLVAPKNN